VKEVFGHGGDISNFVPSEVLKHLKKTQEKT
jgi:phosphopantetheine adenylyltransferase